jgi:hypothetical protein
MPLRARDVDVFAHAKADRFTVLGRLLGVTGQCRGRVIVDGVPSSGTFIDRFSAELNHSRRGEDWLRARVQGVGGLLSPESIVVTDVSEPIGSDVGIEFGKGFFDDEFAHRWAENEATIKLNNRSERPVTVDLLVELHLPAAKPGQHFPVLVRTPSELQEWGVGEPFQKHSLRVSVPPLSTTPIVFQTSAPRVPAESRNLVMMFAMPMRTQEVTCAKPDGGEDARNSGAPLPVH